MDDDLTEVHYKSGSYCVYGDLYQDFFMFMDAEVRENVEQSTL